MAGSQLTPSPSVSPVPSHRFRFAPGDTLDSLLTRNQQWADSLNESAPQLFATNAKGQSPNILWIGCADSRAGEACLDLHPGEVFVHRNIANIVSHSDMSSLAVIQLAVDTLQVEHIIVCGHYDCKGVETTLKAQRLGGELDGWLRHLRDVRAAHARELEDLGDFPRKAERLVELNVMAQVRNLRRNDRVQAAAKERPLHVYGLVYDVASGLLKEVDVDDHGAEHYDVM